MLAALAAAATTFAQRTPVDRYELGLRLRAFERALDSTTDPARRAVAFVELERGVEAFFRLDIDAVARAVDAARLALADGKADPIRAWAGRLWLFTSRRLVDAGAGAVSCELRLVPAPRDGDDAPDVVPAHAAVVVRIPGVAKELVRVAIDALPRSFEIPLDPAMTGDRGLEWSVVVGEETFARREQDLSIVVDLGRRLSSLEANGVARDDLEGETLRALVRTLRGMTRGRREETVLPGSRLLADAESLAALAPDARYYGDARAGQHWLRVPTDAGVVSARLAVPDDEIPDGGRPLVVALHGAGGSENLFCDGYGDGAIVRLCAARGWLLCAPRSAGLTGVNVLALVDALCRRYRIDAGRVFVVGHSMGAMQAVVQATRTPGRFAAVAALGGGGAVSPRADLARLPFFVGAGSRDFGRASAAALHARLVDAGAPATWREYPDVEHFAVVQIALPDVFAFFDGVARGQAAEAPR